MTIFEEIKQEIMADEMNDFYTRKGIPPLFKASKDARIVIVGQGQAGGPTTPKRIRRKMA